MKTIIIGDIHGRTIWKDIVNKEKDFDKFVFIGDYLDTHEDISGEQQLSNLLDIIEFKKANMDKVVLLLGNHDCQYLPFWEEQYSGYQMWQKWNFGKVLEENLGLFQMSYQLPDTNIICSHAGITGTWLKDINSFESVIDNVSEFINDVFKYQPHAFKFRGSDMYGDSVESSPIWVRLPSLALDGINMVQIVGHTIQDKIEEKQGNWGNFTIYPIDTLGTSKEYLVVNSDNIAISKL